VVRGITGWRLPEADREALLMRFPPRYSKIVADHVTLRCGTDTGTELPTEHAGAVIGEADDGSGVQALVVAVGGKSERGDGSHFHLTWSLAEGRKAKESNDVIAARGWRPVNPPIAIMLEPARWRP
jgi:hypothetical protein